MKIPEGAKFENPPAGSHPARCIGLIDLGTQQHKGFQGQPDWASRDVRITFELPEAKMSGVYHPESKGKPFAASITVKQSLHPSSKLRKLLRGWRGRDFTKDELLDFDLRNILGKPCLLSLIENGDYVNIESISGLPKGATTPAQINPTTYLSLEPAEWDAKAFAQLGEKTRAKIESSPEFAALFKSAPEPDAEPDIPQEVGDDNAPW